MNSSLANKLIDRFSIEEIAEVVGITPHMFVQAFSDDIVDNLDSFGEIDLGFLVEKEEE